MCGIAGYSVRARSSVERTLAAQALLAGIAERGADAVGYAYRSAGADKPVLLVIEYPDDADRVLRPPAACDQPTGGRGLVAGPAAAARGSRGCEAPPSQAAHVDRAARDA